MAVEVHRGAAAGRRVASDPAWVRSGLILGAVGLLGLLVVLPVVNVFVSAFADGVGAYWRHIAGDHDTRHAILLTLVIAPTAVALNAVFGIAAAWTIARYRFPGRSVLISVIDLPFAVSPVVAGLMLVLLFGAQGYLGPTLRDMGIQIIFAWGGSCWQRRS